MRPYTVRTVRLLIRIDFFNDARLETECNESKASLFDPSENESLKYRQIT